MPVFSVFDSARGPVSSELKLTVDWEVGQAQNFK